MKIKIISSGAQFSLESCEATINLELNKLNEKVFKIINSQVFAHKAGYDYMYEIVVTLQRLTEF